MEKRYYIAADGGGSKLHAILYDEELNILGEIKTSGTNINFMPKEQVRDNFLRVFDTLISGEVCEIEQMDLCVVCEKDFVLDIVGKYGKIKRVEFHPESVSALAAALEDSATTVLSGTGAGAAQIMGGRRLDGIGGWGSLLGDEGGGYYIGLNALRAAIYSHDGRGEKTLLEQLVHEKYELGDRYFGLVWKMISSSDSRREIASCARLAAEAARANDAVAIRIYEAAAEEMFLYFKAITERNPQNYNGKIVAIGGAWAGYPGMLSHFESLVRAKYPDAEIKRQKYEAVAGPVIRRLLKDGYKMDKIEKILEPKFKSLELNL